MRRFLLLFLVTTSLHASSWFTNGPDGGRVNALALEPASGRLFIGTDNGLFISDDGAATFTRIHNVERFEVTHVAIDGSTIWVAYRQMETLSPSPSPSSRLFHSIDGGATWTEEPLFGSIADLELDAHGTAYVALRCGVETFKGALQISGPIARSTDRGASWDFATGTPSDLFRCMHGVTPDSEQPGVVWAHSWTFTNLPIIASWRSTDGGLTFTRSTTPNSPGRSLIIHPATKRRFAIVGGGTISDYGASGDTSSVVISDDGGATWQPIPLPPELVNPVVAAIAIDPASPDALYLALNSGLYRTPDLGATWTQLLDDATYAIVVTPSRVYAGTAAGLRVGSNLATIDDNATTSLEVQVDPSRPSTLYAWMADVEQKVWIARSRDAGTTWERITDGFGDVKPYFPGLRPRLGVDRDGAVYALQTTNTGNATIARLRPGRTTWERFPYPDVAPYVLVADPTTAGTLYVFAFGPLMRKSTDGGATWSDPVALPHGNFQSITHAAAVDPVDPRILFISTDNDGIERSTDGGRSWTIVNPARADSISISPADHRVIWADLWKSTDGGTTWSQQMAAPITGNRSVTADRNDADTVYVWGNGVARSADGGKTWIRFDDGLPATTITWLASAPNALYAATYRRGIFTRTFQRRRAIR